MQTFSTQKQHAAIFQEWKSGASPLSLSVKYELSKQRIGQIVAKMKRIEKQSPTIFDSLSARLKTVLCCEKCFSYEDAVRLLASDESIVGFGVKSRSELTQWVDNERKKRVFTP